MNILKEKINPLMKIKLFIIRTILLAAGVISILSNCSGHKKDDAMADHQNEAVPADSTSVDASAVKSQFVVDPAFQKQLAGVFTAYIGLKNAFVQSDAGKVKTEAQTVDGALAKVDMKLLSGAAHNDWMTFLSPIQTSLKEIQSSKDIAAQRKSFSALSDNLYKTIKAFGLGGKEAYYEFCPMAFNNEGAHWLSEAEQIRNPYFGDEMLTCGEVKEKLN
jgi:Cu(I)/Ag(I) efflux system membrane fusion protein